VEGDENDQKKDKINQLPLLEEFPNLEPSENNQDNQIKYIAKILADAQDSEVVIKIHGYSSKEDDVTQQYSGVVKDIKEYLKNQKTDKKKTFVFFGYRWPSESPNFKNAWNALPLLPRWILGFSIFFVIGFATLILLSSINKILLILMLVLFSIILATVITLILLRFSAYFRDSYRATNYAVSDLVELLRKLDKEIIAINDTKDAQTKKDYKKTGEINDKIELNFIAHSMGCYVTTNTIRILSDVFDSNAQDKNKPNTPFIGNIFSLNRLILVAPDIPVETIIPRRANFLKSSLSRCKESYLFSNEGDVVLRIASTAANYFSFPASSLFSGYRLGNITVKHDDKKSILPYGIVNLKKDGSLGGYPFDYLDLRSSSKDNNEENITIEKLLGQAPIEDLKKQTHTVTNTFTYFDCTDYKDQENGKDITPVSLATKKPALDLFGYIRLVINHLILHKIDTHGGYFNGNFTKELIHKLAFFGFDGLLNYPSSNNERNEALSKLDENCKEKQIQVVLSPQRIPKQ
jgi:pimeloyl-ACP methyl ester carboxylesterase